jgi:hypothetical protein
VRGMCSSRREWEGLHRRFGDTSRGELDITMELRYLGLEVAIGVQVNLCIFDCGSLPAERGMIVVVPLIVLLFRSQLGLETQAY